MVYKNKKGERFYPVCSWEQNQHKLYNAHDRLMNAMYEGEDVFEELERVERALEAFDRCVIGGVVYATYEDGLLIKDFVWAYNARHK